MNDALPAQRIRNWIDLLRNFSGKASLIGFLFAWPFVTLYIASAWFLVVETTKAGGSAAGCLYFFGAFMLYAYPLVLWLKIKVSYGAIGVAMISVRLSPILVAVVTWLSLKGALPTGIVAWDGTSDWADALFYSALTILAVLLFMRTQAPECGHRPRDPEKRERSPS
jgi:hypothetical protein